MESRIRWDDPCCSLISISELRWTDQFGSLSNTHLSNSFIPTSDNLSLSKIELERFSSISRRVKLFAIWEGSNVVYFDLTSFWRKIFAITGVDCLNFHDLCFQKNINVKYWELCDLYFRTDKSNKIKVKRRDWKRSHFILLLKTSKFPTPFIPLVSHGSESA